MIKIRRAAAGGRDALPATPVSASAGRRTCSSYRTRWRKRPGSRRSAPRSPCPVICWAAARTYSSPTRACAGVVIDLTLLSGLQADGTLVTALGGTPVSALAEFALSRGLAGMEFAYALPGSVGGAVWMNARCYEREISDVLEFVDYLDADNRQQRLPMRRGEWEYKISPFQRHERRDPPGGLPACPGKPAADRRPDGGAQAGSGKEGPLPFPVRGKRVQEQPCIRRTHRGDRGFTRPEGPQDRRRPGGPVPRQHHCQHREAPRRGTSFP